MALATAFQNAGSGLAATARQIHTVSSNVANALTPGYSPRQVTLGQAPLTGGVRVTAISRQTNPVLLGQLRASAATLARQELRADFSQRMENAFGLPGGTDGIAPALERFHNALILAADRPDLEYRLAAIETSAQALVTTFNQVSETIQSERLAADARIASDIAALNSGLAQLHSLNLDILRLQASGQPSHEAEDTREVVLAALSEIVPLRTHQRDDGRVMVYSAAGQLLLDLSPALIGFTPASVVAAGDSLSGGQLSGLTVNGQPASSTIGGMLSGGRLEAAFAIRDHEGPAAQAELDQLAHDLINRFQDATVDPSLAPFQPGLFTDSGTLATGLPGVAGRLELNALIRPSLGGDLNLLRSGLGGGASSGVGDPAQLNRLVATLERPISRSPGSSARSFEGHLATALSSFGQQNNRDSGELLRVQSAHHVLVTRQLETGVDTDLEMQRLLLLEESYAANARVLQVVDDLLRQILEI